MDLVRYESYSREDLHNMFSPERTFKPGAGKWGLQGIISVPNTKADFIFFVTFGTTIAHHTFKEGITEDGVLTWQSQPQQTFDNKQIRTFFAHNPAESNIYLLLRTKKSTQAYTYLGKLAYLSHNPTVDKPVQFQWQILDWEIKEELFASIGLTLSDAEIEADPYSEKVTIKEKNTLIHVTQYPNPKIWKTLSPKIRKPVKRDYKKKAERAQKIGLLGEKLVLEQEQKRLKLLGIDKEVIHKAAQGDGEGYDILSYTESGEPMYIEVKTTLSGINTPFDISANEVLFSDENPDHFYIYRLFNYSEEYNSAEHYIINGSVAQKFHLEPTNYKAYYSGQDD